MKDKILLGALVGILADAVKLLVNYIAYVLNFTSVVFWQITATRFLEKNALHKPIAYFIGGVADVTVSALLGIVFIYFISFFGSKRLLLKGMGYGLVIWVGLFGTLLGQSLQEKLPQTPSGIIVTMVAHFFFGLALALFSWWLKENGDEVENNKYNVLPQPMKKIKRKVTLKNR